MKRIPAAVVVVVAVTIVAPSCLAPPSTSEHVGSALEDENVQYCASACAAASHVQCWAMNQACSCEADDRDSRVAPIGIYKLNCLPACDAACIRSSFGERKCFNECLTYGRSASVSDE